MKTSVEEKTYLKPKLGKTVYCIYKGGILMDTVGYLGKDSFIVDGFGSSTYEDSWKWYYNNYNSDWFTSFAKAKKTLLEQAERDFGQRFKVIQTYPDFWILEGGED